ncbi:Uncharacterised protein [Brucella melitensis]|nr:Uncharacterised protein [Brucella melitensis]
MEHVARCRIRSRPYGNRQQHDIAGGEGCHAKRDQKARESRILVLRHVENMCFIAEPAQRIDDIWRRFAILPAQRDAARGQVDAHIGNTGNLSQCILNGLDAESAMDPRHRKVELAQPVAERTTCDLHFFRRNGLNDGRYLCILDAAAHKIFPSFTRTRMMCR